jgi:hypothetical protein
MDDLRKEVEEWKKLCTLQEDEICDLKHGK